MPDFSPILTRLNIKFKDPKLLEQAFTHRSYLNEIKLDLPSNERLEFLGDSVLSLVVSSCLFIGRTNDNEGDLTNLRAYIVKTKSLSQVAQKLQLGKYLKLSHGEELGGGRDNPQLLANTYEALLGAKNLFSKNSVGNIVFEASGKVPEIFNFLKSHGYNFYLILI